MTTSPPPSSGRSSRKTVRYLAGAAMVSGGLVVGALFSPIGIAGAQGDGETQSDGELQSETVETPAGDEGHRGRAGHRGGGRHHRNHHRLENLSDISGLSAEQLREGFEAGQTLAETAAANGIDVDTLAADLEAAATDRINEAVTEGHLTQEEADEKTDGVADRIDELLNRTPGQGRDRGDAPNADEGETVESSLST